MSESLIRAAPGVEETFERLSAGAQSARSVVEERLALCDALEPQLRAWAHIDPDLALRRADALDAHRASGQPLGPLHGVCVGLKDIIDTEDMPTELGSAIEAGRRPRRDSAVARRLRRAGATLLGKTVTTEFAYFAPRDTRNPHNPAHTPGGSSSGSAAAVAAGMVPAAIGTQTNGSMIRPASFCGVVGFKPSLGRIPRSGVMEASRAFDTLGVFARSVEDAARVAEPLFGPDPGDRDAAEAGGAGLMAVAGSPPPVRPRLAFVKTPVWERADPVVHQAFEELREALADDLEPFELPLAYEKALPLHRMIMAAEMAATLGRYVEAAPDQVSAQLTALVEEGRGISAPDYLRARAEQAALSGALDTVFEEYDAVVTPAALGEAPFGLETTGDPAFCTIWSLCGAPSVSLPLMTGPNGLPIGVQVVGGRGDDARLLRTARWLNALVLNGA